MKFLNKYLVAFAFLFLLFGAKETLACTCAPPDRATNAEFQKSTAVFTGRVLQVTRKENAANATVKLSVLRYWKGKLSNTVKIITARDSASCGFNFETGKDYLVYATETDGKLSTSICSRTALIGTAPPQS